LGHLLTGPVGVIEVVAPGSIDRTLDGQVPGAVHAVDVVEGAARRLGDAPVVARQHPDVKFAECHELLRTAHAVGGKAPRSVVVPLVVSHRSDECGTDIGKTEQMSSFFRSSPGLTAGHGHLTTVRYLFTKGMRCSYVGMEWAASNSRLNVVKFLLLNNVLVTPRALHLASHAAHIEMSRILFFAGGILEPAGMALAARGGKLKEVKLYVSLGIPIESALMKACERGRLNIIDYLFYEHSDKITIDNVIDALTMAKDNERPLVIDRLVGFMKSPLCTF